MRPGAGFICSALLRLNGRTNPVAVYVYIRSGYAVRWSSLFVLRENAACVPRTSARTIRGYPLRAVDCSAHIATLKGSISCIWFDTWAWFLFHFFLSRCTIDIRLKNAQIDDQVIYLIDDVRIILLCQQHSCNNTCTRFIANLFRPSFNCHSPRRCAEIVYKPRIPFTLLWRWYTYSWLACLMRDLMEFHRKTVPYTYMSHSNYSISFPSNFEKQEWGGRLLESSSSEDILF